MNKHTLATLALAIGIAGASLEAKADTGFKDALRDSLIDMNVSISTVVYTSIPFTTLDEPRMLGNWPVELLTVFDGERELVLLYPYVRTIKEHCEAGIKWYSVRGGVLNSNVFMKEYVGECYTTKLWCDDPKKALGIPCDGVILTMEQSPRNIVYR